MIPQAVTGADHAEVLELNEAAVPHVNSVNAEVLEDLAQQAFYFRLIRAEGLLGGFLLALAEEARYGSPNFTWFQARYERFAYIDRVVVNPALRRAGIARLLYEDLERAATTERELLACEVNIRPPNPGSVAFHERMGFREVGQQDTEDGAKRVSLMTKRLTPPGAR